MKTWPSQSQSMCALWQHDSKTIISRLQVDTAWGRDSVERDAAVLFFRWNLLDDTCRYSTNYGHCRDVFGDYSSCGHDGAISDGYT